MEYILSMDDRGIETKTIEPWKFQPGNPGGPGRKAMPPELKEAFRAASIDAQRVLLAIMLDKEEKASDRIHAAEVMLERGYGKAEQAVDVAFTDGEAILKAFANADDARLCKIAGVEPPAL